jgi:hypothetical protein
VLPEKYSPVRDNGLGLQSVYRAPLGRPFDAAGFEKKNLRRMMHFAEVFPRQQIVASLMRQLASYL